MLFIPTLAALHSDWLGSLVSVAQATTGTNKTVNFQGKVVNTDGTNVANGSYSFTFKIYTVSSAGTATWTETKSLTVTDGIFQTALGDTTTLPGSVDFNTDNIYLGVTFNGDPEMSPRIRFAAVPQAMNALKVAGLTVTDTTGTLTIPNGKTISFADAFTTSGANALTLTTSATTNATLPAGTITLADLTTAQTLTNKTIGSTGLVFSGASTDITTGTDENLTITPNGTGNLTVSSAALFNGNLTIGDASSDTVTVNSNAWTFANDTDFTLSGGVNGLSFDGTTFSVDAANDRIGIGTAAPSFPLQIVNGSASGTLAQFRNSTDAVDLNILSSTTGSARIIVRTGSGDGLSFGANGVSDYINIDSSGNVGIGTGTSIGARLQLAGDISSGAWGLNGVGFRGVAATYTDSTTATSGTATNGVINSFGQPTIAASNTGVTVTNAATLYVAAAPTAGTNVTLTNSYALWLDSGNFRADDSVTLGDASGDSVTANAASWTFNNDTNFTLSGGVNGLSFDGTTFSVDATGNKIGIGTAAPSYALHVTGGSGFFDTAVNTTPLTIGRAAKTSDFEEIRVGTDDAATYFYYLNDEASSKIQFRLQNTDTETGGGAAANDNTVLTLTGGTNGGFVGVGTTSPASHLAISGSISDSAWTVVGKAFDISSSTYTDTSSAAAATVASRAVASFRTPTLASTNAITITDAANLYIGAAPTAGSNTTITNAWALMVDAGNVRLDDSLTIGDGSSDTVTANAATWTFANDTNFALSGGVNGLSFDTSTFSVDATNDLIGIGTTAPGAKLHIAGNVSTSAWSTNGVQLRLAQATYTDTSSSGTVAAAVGAGIDIPIFAASSATTYTDSSTLYVKGAPSAGSNVTLTSGRSFSLWVDSGQARFDGLVGIGNNTTTVQTSALQINSSTTANHGTTGRLLSVTGTNTSTETGTVSSGVSSSFAQPTFATSAGSALTITDAANLYVAGAPTAGTDTTLTRPWSFWVDAGDVRMDGNLQIGGGNIAAAAQLHIGGGISAAAWTINGIGLRVSPGTYTDTSSSGTVASMTVHNFNQPTVAASSTTTYTDASTLRISNAPSAGSNVTITNPWALWIDAGNLRLDDSLTIGDASGDAVTANAATWTFANDTNFALSGGVNGLSFDTSTLSIDATNDYVGIGTTSPAAKLQLSGNVSASNWTVNGIALRVAAATYTNSSTATSGTVSQAAVNTFEQPTLAASNTGVTTTHAATLYVADAPAAGTNQTITNAYALWIDNGDSKLDGRLIVNSSSAPIAAFAIGNTAISAAAWGTDGIIGRFTTGGTYTDTSSSGTVASVVGSSFAAPTLAASSSTTYTNAATLYLSNAPSAGTNVTLTNPYALWADNGDTRLDGRLAVNIAGPPAAALQVGNVSLSAASWTTSGIRFRADGGTYTDTSSSGTVSQITVDNLAQPTLAASSATTYTTASTLRIGNAPSAGTNVTITNAYALSVDNGMSRFVGNVRVGGSTAPTVALDVTGAASISTTLAVTSDTTLTGDLAVNGGDLTTSASTFNLLNATATTLNIGGAATALALGASSGTLTLNNPTITLPTDTNFALSGGVNGLAFDTDTLSIDATSNYVGVGTTAPASYLHVSIANGAGDVAAIIQNNATTANETASLLFRTTTSTNDFGRVQTLRVDGNNSKMSFATLQGSGNFANTLTLDNQGFAGIGTTSPAGKLHIAGNVTASAWGTAGIALQSAAATFTDSSTATSGTATTAVIHSFAQPILAASNTGVTTTNAANVYIAGAPTAGTNQTINNAYALWVNGRSRIDGTLAVGVSGFPSQTLRLGGNISSSVQALTGGNALRFEAATYTDSTSSGTVATAVAYGLGTPTFATSSTTTFTDAASLYVAAPPTAGTNVTLTNSYALWLDSGNFRVDDSVTLGDASGDTVTANAATWTFANDTDLTLSGGINGLSFDGTTFSVDATNNRIGIGTAAPATTLHAISTTEQLRLGYDTSNYLGFTTTSTGSTSLNITGASNADLTLNAQANLILGTGGTDDVQIGRTDLSNFYTSINSGLTETMRVTGNMVGIGTSVPAGKLHVAGNLTASAWGLNGIQAQHAAATFTDSSTANSGTATNAVFNSFAQPTLAASNTSVTTSNAATVYIADAPTAGTNQTITNAYALWIDNGASRFDGKMVINTSAGTGTLTGSGVSIDNASLTTGTGLNVQANSFTGGRVANITSTSTAGTGSGSSYTLYLDRSGANSNTAHTAYGLYSTVTNTNATSGTNVAAYLSASGATTANYGLIVAAGTVGIGTATPTSRLQLAGDQTAAAWGTGGIALQSAAATYTDSSSSGTVATATANSFGAPTYAASSSTTYSDSTNVYIAAAPTAGTNVSQTHAYALWVDSGTTRLDGRLSVGVSSDTTSTVLIGGSLSTGTPWGVNGVGLRFNAATYTDTVSSGTVAASVGYGFGIPTFATSSSTTFTNSATFYIAGAPTAGSNVTQTNSYALWIDAGNARFDGNVVVGNVTSATPNGVLEVNGSFSGTASAIGRMFRVDASTITDSGTAASGTATINIANSFNQPTFAATNSNVTTTDAVNLYIADAPAAGSNQTLTNAWALWVDAGAVRFDGIVVYAPSSIQTLAAAGTISPNAAKVKVAGSGPSVTLTSTPTISAGKDGQYLIIAGTDDTNTVTVQDKDSLASSALQLQAASRTLGKGDILVLTYDSTDGFWYEISYANN